MAFLGNFWVVVDGCGWLWMIVGGCGWLWAVVDGCRWLWLVVAGCGWLWLVAYFSVALFYRHSEAHSEPCQTSKIKLFAK